MPTIVKKSVFRLNLALLLHVYTCARHPWRVADNKLPRFPFAVSLLSVNSVC